MRKKAINNPSRFLDSPMKGRQEKDGGKTQPSKTPGRMGEGTELTSRICPVQLAWNRKFRQVTVFIEGMHKEQQ